MARKDAADRVVTLASVVGRFSRNLAAPGAPGIRQQCPSHMVPGIWIGTFSQQELNKVEVGHGVRIACLVQGRSVLWGRYSVDVGAVFNKLFC
jgi:hypothetical protein